MAVLWDANTGEYQLRAMAAAAKAVSIELQVLAFRDSTGLESVLRARFKERPHALLLLGSPLINQLAGPIADFSMTHRLPGISPFRSFPERGGMMSYGPNLPTLYRALARADEVIR
jgi:putative ABC transport system substrate-binding protein